MSQVLDASQSTHIRVEQWLKQIQRYCESSEKTWLEDSGAKVVEPRDSQQNATGSHYFPARGAREPLLSGNRNRYQPHVDQQNTTRSHHDRPRYERATLSSMNRSQPYQQMPTSSQYTVQVASGTNQQHVHSSSGNMIQPHMNQSNMNQPRHSLVQSARANTSTHGTSGNSSRFQENRHDHGMQAPLQNSAPSSSASASNRSSASTTSSNSSQNSLKELNKRSGSAAEKLAKAVTAINWCAQLCLQNHNRSIPGIADEIGAFLAVINPQIGKLNRIVDELNNPSSINRNQTAAVASTSRPFASQQHSRHPSSFVGLPQNSTTASSSHSSNRSSASTTSSNSSQNSLKELNKRSGSAAEKLAAAVSAINLCAQLCLQNHNRSIPGIADEIGAFVNEIQSQIEQLNRVVNELNKN